MKTILRPVAVALFLTTYGGIAWSQTQTAPSQPEPPSEIEQMIVDGLTKAMNMISFAWGSVVPYAMPEVLPNGDIIIRHKSPKTPPTEDPPNPFGLGPDAVNGKPESI